MKTIKIESIGHEPIVLNVPEGAKVSIEDGLTIVEPEFKKGDIVYQNNVVVIFSGKYGNETQNGIILNSKRLWLDKSIGLHKNDIIRHATESEKQILFDALAKAGKAWDADKKEIVDLKYVPKVGDCVKIIYPSGNKYFCEVSDVKGYQIGSINVVITTDGVYFEKCNKYFTYDSIEKITPEELQSEFNKLGYEYDFETHTAKKLRWKPEIGESYFTTNGFNDIICHKWINDNTDNRYYNLCKCFKTEADAQKYKEYILKYHEQDN